MLHDDDNDDNDDDNDDDDEHYKKGSVTTALWQLHNPMLQSVEGHNKDDAENMLSFFSRPYIDTSNESQEIVISMSLYISGTFIIN